MSRRNSRFGFSPAGKGVAASLDWLQLNLPRRKPEDDAPQEIVAKAGQRHITREDGSLDMGAYVSCTLDAVAELMPRVDLPEILLEIAARTGFSVAFTHVSERNARGDNLVTSLCAVLFGGACNIGLEPLIRNNNQALRRDRLSWVSQNYLRDDTLSAANAILVAAQSQLVYFRENQRLGLSLLGRQKV